MSQPDLILLHPPSVMKFREQPSFFGPVSDVVPSTSIFEIYPIGFLTISDHLRKHGLAVRIVNMAVKMLRDPFFDPARFIKRLNPAAFGIDLHWLPHVDGALSLAEMTKRYHPDTPVILGGLSSTYYYEEIMREYPFVDYVVRGDSTEEPVRMLLNAIRAGGGYGDVPNLVWRDNSGKVMTNELSFRPEDLDYISFNYAHLLKMAMKYRDPSGYIPFRFWLTYPVTAVFQCRGCNRNCGSCAGSVSSFRRFCLRERPCFRSPELLARDIGRISEYTGAPVMVIGDILQAGEAYADNFLEALRQQQIKNEVTIEFFSPPPVRFLTKVAASLKNFNVEISPESHDPKVRSAFGKNYDNEDLEKTIEILLDLGCKRIDLFFMVGLPYQDRQSVMDTVDYCERLLQKFGRTKKILPMIAPLAPFIDPGSRIFEEPEKFGYRLFYKTLKEHRSAMLMPSWKYGLNYETVWMTREDIVRATYDAALRLVEMKTRYGIIGKEKGDLLGAHIRRAVEIVERIDRDGSVAEDLKSEILSLNFMDSLCDKHELEWPIKGWRLNILKVLRLLLQ
jgi:B12-binding domain/radical SAM domain protein